MYTIGPVSGLGTGLMALQFAPGWLGPLNYLTGILGLMLVYGVIYTVALARSVSPTVGSPATSEV